MDTVSVGFIGAGFSAHLHVEGLKQVHGVGVRLAAVTAGRAGRAAAFAQAQGVAKVGASWQDRLAERKSVV